MNKVKIETFDPQSATQENFEEITQFRNAMRAEADPDDTPRSVEHTIKSLKNLPPIAKLYIWLAREGNKIVGVSNIIIMDLEENKHLAQASIQVLPEYRRQGLAKRLLTPILEVAQANNKSLLIDDTNSNIPSGEAFMKRLNARPGIAMHINQLLISELDRELMKTWQQKAKERAPEFDLLLWEGSIPEMQLATYCEMKDLMNTQPLDDLEVEDMKMTPELVRQVEAHREAKGDRHWTVIARYKPTGEFAGYTETLWNPEDKITLNQEDTAVMPKYRGNSLGRWLKAAMIEHVLAEVPTIKRVRTGNADSNDAMLKINTEMGFKPYRANTLWQLDVSEIEKYLDE